LLAPCPEQKKRTENSNYLALPRWTHEDFAPKPGLSKMFL